MRRPLTPAQRGLAYQREEQLQMARRFQRVFASEDGQRVLNHILHGLAGVDVIRADPNALITYEAMGRRNLALMIAALAAGVTPKTADEVKHGQSDDNSDY